MRMRFGLMILFLAGLLALIRAPESVSGAKPKRLRAEIAEMKAKIAQLQSQTDFQLRRLAVAPSMPGTGLCTDPCSVDSDGDGLGDCEDVCPCDPSTVDGDGDGTPDCADPCPNDPVDDCINPCRQDSDGDGVNDCEDPCPWDPNGATDADEDGVPDCADPCPDNKSNDCFFPCPLDADGDGRKDCIDPCPWGSAMPCIEPASGGTVAR